MADWQLHWLEAEGSLAPWRARIEEEVAAAHRAVARLLQPPRLDVLVQRLRGAAIPELGLVGHAYRRSLFSLTLDPDNPNFAAALHGDTLRRHVAHEVHHCLRMGGPGYGRTLGEALVSEGLAGHFSQECFGGAPEIWETALDVVGLRVLAPQAKAALARADYGHDAWFFGRGEGAPPRWAGYTLGFALVCAYLTADPDARPSALAGAPAAAILDDAWPRLFTVPE